MNLTWIQLTLTVAASLLTGAFYTVYLLRQTIGAEAFNVIFTEMGEQSMKNISTVIGKTKEPELEETE